jgi:2-keto-4-pentenoate hydratase/2-oxohepta-3-ene-1,7-dioic acid hydratase in catechol pathway
MKPWYALGTCRSGGGSRTMLVMNGQAYPLAKLAKGLGSLQAIIGDWDRLGGNIDKLATQVEQAAARGDLRGIAADPGKFLAPFAPYRIFGAASNFIEHAAEMQTKLAAKADSTPFVFLKSQSSVIGPGQPIVIPRESKQVDWEVELGVVIGTKGRRIPVGRALSHIAGYVVVNDVSARDLTRRSDFPFSHDWFRGKSFDSFTPIGPWFVPRDCVSDPHELSLKLSVNGVMMQDGNSKDMIFNCFEQIAYLSQLLQLRPGDLLATGTPAGVGMGRGIFLKPGDQVLATIEGIGALANPVIAEAG